MDQHKKPFDPTKGSKLVNGRFVNSCRNGKGEIQASQPSEEQRVYNPTSSISGTSVARTSRPKTVTAANGFTFDVTSSDKPFDPTKTCMMVGGRYVNVHRESIFDVGSPRSSTNLGTTSMMQESSPKKVTAANGFTFDVTSSDKPFDPTKTCMMVGGRYVNVHRESIFDVGSGRSQAATRSGYNPSASLGTTSTTQPCPPKKVKAANGFTFDIAPSNKPFDPTKTSMIVGGKHVNVHRESIFDIGSPKSQATPKQNGGYPVASPTGKLVNRRC